MSHRPFAVFAAVAVLALAGLPGCTCGSSESAEDQLSASLASALQSAVEQAAGDPAQVTGHCSNPSTSQCTEYRGNHLVPADTLQSDCTSLGGAWGEGACPQATYAGTCEASSLVIRYTAPEEQNPIMPRQDYCRELLQGTYTAGAATGS